MEEHEINGLTEELERLKEQCAQLLQEKDKIEFDRKIEKALIKENVKKVQMVKALLDMDKLNIDETGCLYGLAEQLEALALEVPSLFYENEVKKVQTGSFGSYLKTQQMGEKNPWSKEHFNLTKQSEIYKKNPSLAKRLMNEVDF